MIDEAEDVSDEQQLDLDAIWGERAESLVVFVKTQSPPVKPATVRGFMERRTWSEETLRGVVAYAIKRGLLARHKCINGEWALKLPLTPVHEEEGEAALEPAAGAVRAQRHDSEARTAPAANYGCPEHGSARRAAEEKPTMAKHWVTTAEAVELLGCSQEKTSQLARTNKIESRKTGPSRSAPREFRRSSLIAYLAAEKKRAAAGDLLEKAPPRQKQIAARVVKLHKKERTETTARPSRIPPPAGGDLALADDVRALDRNVRRGWMSIEDAWSKLRELVA